MGMSLRGKGVPMGERSRRSDPPRAKKPPIRAAFDLLPYFSGSSTITGASGAFLATEAMPFLALALAL